MPNTLLNIEEISLKIPSIETPILSGINYEVNKGDFVIILGSNGSGKSSLMKLIDKRYTASSGKISLDSKLIEQYTNKEYSKKIITLTQDCHESLFLSLTVFENYLLVKQRNTPSTHRANQNRDFFANYIKEFNPNLASKMDQIVGKLSGGEKQALALALSVLYPPDLLLLDEHTSALDPKSAQQLMELTNQIIKKHQITCILTTHNLDIAKHYGNRVLALKHGRIYKIINDDRKHLLSQQELLTACY